LVSFSRAGAASGQTASEGGDVVLGVQRAGKQGEPAGTVPWETRLESAAPNPFNSGTVLRYMVSGEVHVDLAIYDIQGRLVRRLVNAKQRQGAYRVAWDGQDHSGRPVGNGIYLARLVAEPLKQSRKLVLIR
jgi:hypothetical protein